MRRVLVLITFAVSLASCAPTAVPGKGRYVAPPSTPPKAPRPALSFPVTGPNLQAGEKPPQFPDAARTFDAAGAVAFARFFVQALDWAVAVNRGSPIRDLSLPSCPCIGFAGLLDALQGGARLEGGRISIGAATLKSPFNRGFDAVVNIELALGEMKIFRSDGSVAKVVDADRGSAVVSLGWTESGWRVSSYGFDG